MCVCVGGGGGGGGLIEVESLDAAVAYIDV